MDSLKQVVKHWLDQDEDRMTEDEGNEWLHAAMPQADLSQLDQIKDEIFIELVVDNLKSMPHLKFHAQKDLFPYPNSKQLQRAKEIVFPEGETKETH